MLRTPLPLPLLTTSPTVATTTHPQLLPPSLLSTTARHRHRCYQLATSDAAHCRRPCYQPPLCHFSRYQFERWISPQIQALEFQTFMSHGTQKKRVAGARRKGFDPLWFNEGGAWKLIHIGESKFEKPIHFSILVP